MAPPRARAPRSAPLPAEAKSGSRLAAPQCDARRDREIEENGRVDVPRHRPARFRLPAVEQRADAQRLGDFALAVAQDDGHEPVVEHQIWSSLGLVGGWRLTREQYRFYMPISVINRPALARSARVDPQRRAPHRCGTTLTEVV